MKSIYAYVYWHFFNSCIDWRRNNSHRPVVWKSLVISRSVFQLRDSWNETEADVVYFVVTYDFASIDYWSFEFDKSISKGCQSDQS